MIRLCLVRNNLQKLIRINKLEIMITQEEYEEAQKIVWDYEDQLKKQGKAFDTSEETALNIDLVSSCYAVFDEEDNIVQLYQTEYKANKGMEEFKRSHEHTDFYVDTMQIN